MRAALIPLLLLGAIARGDTPAQDGRNGELGSCAFEYGLGEFTGGAECARGTVGGREWETIELSGSSWDVVDGEEASLAWMDRASWPRIKLMQNEFQLGDVHKAGLMDSVLIIGALLTSRSYYAFDTGTLTIEAITDSSISGHFAFETTDMTSSSMAHGPEVLGSFHARRKIENMGCEPDGKGK